jgi:predicted methyltransferase
LAPVNPIRVTERAQALAGEVLKPGDIAIDATAGKGRDTAFLAMAVGPKGHVHSFDVQAEAITATQNLIDAAGLNSLVTLHHRSHAEISEALPANHQHQVGAVLFNLGYLPGSDQKIVTQPASTLHALQAARDQIRPGGRIICVTYTGHPGGTDESNIVLQFAVASEKAGYTISKVGYFADSAKPWILVVTRT